MIKIIEINKIIFISLFLYLTIDFVFGDKFLKKFGLIYLEETIRVPNKDYSYSFEKNLNSDYAVWGNQYYKLCTDSRGFKYNCLDKENKFYELAFIGDSFTEGIGLPFEKTFVGIFKENTKKNIVNLGVASYSPYIYLKKVKHLISNNIIRFEHLIVAIDLTDLEDDWQRSYKVDEENQESKIFNTNATLKDKFDVFKYHLKVKLMRNFPVSYIILKRINWFIKLNYSDEFNVDHLNYNSNKASWSYDDLHDNLNLKIDKHIKIMEEMSLFLKENNIKLSVMIYPHQASIKYDKKDSLYKKIWVDFCNKNKCEKLIDSYTPFFDELRYYSKEEIIKKYYIPGDFHFNENGNKKIFEILKINLI